MAMDAYAMRCKGFFIGWQVWLGTIHGQAGKAIGFYLDGFGSTGFTQLGFALQRWVSFGSDGFSTMGWLAWHGIFRCVRSTLFVRSIMAKQSTAQQLNLIFFKHTTFTYIQLVRTVIRCGAPSVQY